jgi:hypothetical protein
VNFFIAVTEIQLSSCDRFQQKAINFVLLTTGRNKWVMESVKNKVNDIMFYGERGVVNGIILDIKDDLEKVKDFLRSIRFVEGKLKWADDLESVIWWVEPNFS